LEAILWKDLDHANVLPFLGVNMNPAVCGPSFALISSWLPNGSIMSYMETNVDFDRIKAVSHPAI